MAAVFYVATHIGQVHQQRRHPVPNGLIHIADLCGDDGSTHDDNVELHSSSTDRRIKVTLFTSGGKSIAQQEHGQHHSACLITCLR